MHRSKKIKLILITILSIHLLHAKNIHKEKYYQNIFCNQLKGITEYTLKDKTRVDCSTKTLAIEVDFANKWAESIGQSLYYGLQTDKIPVVVLIIERKYKDIKYLKRLLKVAKG